MASGTVDAPVKHSVAITPDVALAYTTTGVWVGTGGNLEVIMEAGNTVLFNNVPTGIIMPIRIKKVVSTNTTATDLVAMWN